MLVNVKTLFFKLVIPFDYSQCVCCIVASNWCWVTGAATVWMATPAPRSSPQRILKSFHMSRCTTACGTARPTLTRSWASSTGTWSKYWDASTRATTGWRVYSTARSGSCPRTTWHRHIPGLRYANTTWCQHMPTLHGTSLCQGLC